MPAGTPVAENIVAVLSVSKLVMFEAPLLVPASMTYEFTGINGEDGAAVQVSTTVVLLVLLARPVGGPLGAARPADSTARRRDAQEASRGADPKMPIERGALDATQLHGSTSGAAAAGTLAADAAGGSAAGRVGA